MPLLFSIIIPCYNPGAKLADTIDSALAQPADGFEFEVIIVDGGSADAGTLAALARYSADTRVTIISEPDKGVYDAMNKGITASLGAYLNFLGAGDRLMPDALESVAGVERAYPPKPQVIYGDALMRRSGTIAGGLFTISDFRRKRNIVHQAMFFSRELFDLFGLFDLRYPIRADNVFNMRLWAADESVERRYIDETLADYEEGGLSDTRVDTAFEQDFGSLVRVLYGWRQYAIYLLASVKYRAVAARKRRES